MNILNKVLFNRVIFAMMDATLSVDLQDTLQFHALKLLHLPKKVNMWHFSFIVHF